MPLVDSSAAMDTLYYCGFNGFHQVPSSSNGGHTLTTLSPHSQHKSCAGVVDVAVCWNHLVVADKDGVTKYGLVNGGKQNGRERLKAPKEGDPIKHLSATPRHLLICTEQGECHQHEEGKGWRRVNVGAEERPASSTQMQSPSLGSENGGKGSGSSTPEDDKPNSGGNSGDEGGGGGGGGRGPVDLVKTSCGDNHNLGLDSTGLAYSLPSPLEFDVFPSDTRHNVVDVVCGKEHCLLLTEHGQVFSWGGGSRGQLGHGTLSSEAKPRLVTALDGLRITKIAAGGWHSACISQFNDLYMFGWNESGQLAQTTNLVKPAECFSAVEKLLMACCTMQPEDAAQPRGGTEDCEVYHKHQNDEEGGGNPAADSESVVSSNASSAVVCGRTVAGCTSSSADVENELEKEALTCYDGATGCGSDSQTDMVVVQNVPMLVQMPGE